MSRTYKDVPSHVIRSRAMKEGHINHDHTPSRYFHARRTLEEFEFGPTEETEAENLYYTLLSKGHYVDFTKHKIVDFKYDEKNNEYEFFDRVQGFTVALQELIETRHSQECIDAEHYDARYNKDTRNGKFVSCEPDVFSYLMKNNPPKKKTFANKGYRWRMDDEYTELYGAHIARDTLRKAAVAYNSGDNLEDFDFTKIERHSRSVIYW